MFVRRRHRLITVLFALCSLLFMELAIAGYACPVDTGKLETVAMAVAGMPCAGEMSSRMDSEQPGLCNAHCQSAQQTVDKVQSPAPMGAMATGFIYAIELVRRAPPAHPPQAPSLLRTTAPPISIRNCCFRI